MKYFIAIILLYQSLFLFGQESNKKIKDYDIEMHTNKIIGKQFNQFNVKTPGFTDFSNTNLKGKIAFVNFWFETCPPCIAELEGFNKLFDTLKYNKNFIFVTFTYDPDSTIQNLKKKYNIQYQVFHIDRDECYRLNFNTGFPASFILDRNGVVKFAKIGGVTDIELSTKDVMSKIYPRIIKEF